MPISAIIVNMHKLKQTTKSLILVFVSMILAISISGSGSQTANATPDGLLFPVIGPARFSNDFTGRRDSGQHNATDIFADKGQKVVSATDGTITYVAYPQPSWGYMVTVRDADGFTYEYIHLNNDTPGTDDGLGGGSTAFAPDIKQGYPIKRGQFIGYVGDSGNAESTPAHLHFEITASDGRKINPFDHLPQAQRIGAPVLYPQLNGETLPYGNDVGASVNIASGNLSPQAGNEYVTGAGPGGGPHVRIFNSNNQGIDGGGFLAYDASFKGGVNVAVGDVTGDGADDIITGTGPGSSTHVAIYTPSGGYQGGFFAYPGFNVGVNIATGDVDGDGVKEIITGTGPGSSSHVKIFKANGTEINSFFAYPGYNVGVNVAAGDVVGDNKSEVVTAAGPNGGSHVAIFSKEGTYLNGFFVYPGFYGGTNISVGEVRSNSAKSEIITAPYSGGGPDIRIHNFYGSMLAASSSYETWWSGGYSVAPAGNNKVKISTGGNRRSSVRDASF